MQAVFLRKYLEEKVNTEELKIEIFNGVSMLRENLNKKGYSSPIYLKCDEVKFFIKNLHIKKLCRDFINGKLDQVEICYIATAIELSEDFIVDSQELEEIVSYLSEDPDLNNPISKKEIQELYEAL